MISAPKRRCFRWSLQTMFVAVTVFACWLGWQVHIVRERRALREWFANSETLLDGQVDTIRQPARIPFWRSWLRDQPTTCIWLHIPDEDTERRVRCCFPEAEVRVYVF
jgi:hypothetical protein